MDINELTFQNNKSALQDCCCDSSTTNKIQAYSIHEAGYRIYCQLCCACSDGITMDIAIANFKNKVFKYGPQ